MADVAERYTLKRPMKAEEGKEAITEITFRTLYAGDLRVLDKVQGNVARAIAMISRLSGIDQATIERFDAQDFSAMAELIGMDSAE